VLGVNKKGSLAHHFRLGMKWNDLKMAQSATCKRKQGQDHWLCEKYSRRKGHVD
jgi:hypothetical protein